jgi:hypothetical protein
MYLWHYEDHEVWVDGRWEDYGHWEDTDGDGYADTWVVDGQTWIDGHYEMAERFGITATSRKA